MIKNLLLIAIRNFKKDKWFSLLNILGLTIGITFSLFLIFYITDKLNYDLYNEKADRVFRIISYIHEKDKNTNWAITQAPLAATLKKDFPEVEESGRFMSRERTLFKNGNNNFYETKVYYADSTIFNIFTYKFVEGNAAHALNEPSSIVIIRSLAEKYFGKNTPAVGKTLRTVYDVYKVTAVLEDVPQNSHLRFDMLISWSTLPKNFNGGENWGSFNDFTYVLLKRGANADAFNKKLVSIYKKYVQPIFAQFNVTMRYDVQPITSIHLHSKLEQEPEELGSMSYIWIFSAVAFFMLLIACINYMNLTTARSARRAKEIGIRKVTGSSKLQLVSQFLVESTLTALFALLLSIGFIALFLPTFNTLSGKFISFDTLLQPDTLFILLAIILFVGLVGGSYPAFYLSKFNPVSVLKGRLSKGSSNITLRRALVVVQFSISMIMLICTWVVYAQLKYLRSKDLGFNKDQVLTVSANSDKDLSSNIRSFKNEMRNNPQVRSVSTAQAVPGVGISFNLFSIQTKNGFTDKGVDCYGADEDYFKTLGMKIVKGRNFSGLPDTLRSIIVNENMVKEYGWGDNPIGKKVRYPGDTSNFYLEVIGVVKDFNQKSLYNPIAPLIIFYRPNSNGMQLKLDAKNITAAVSSVERSWKKYFPELPFAYTFLDQDFDSQYAADKKRGKIFTAFSILTILITCLGLLGLIAFTTQQRQKEISIRKVMGANISQIIPLVTRNFIALVGLSCVIAFPVAWYFMSNWLKIFPYNTGLSITPFILSAFAVLIITLLTVIFHTLRAAVANPVKALRTE